MCKRENIQRTHIALLKVFSFYLSNVRTDLNLTVGSFLCKKELRTPKERWACVGRWPIECWPVLIGFGLFSDIACSIDHNRLLFHYFSCPFINRMIRQYSTVCAYDVRMWQGIYSHHTVDRNLNAACNFCFDYPPKTKKMPYSW